MRVYQSEKQAGRLQMEARPKVPGVVQLKQRQFDPRTGADLGLQLVEELTRAELDSRIATAEAELRWLKAMSADFDAIADTPSEAAAPANDLKG